MIAVKVSVVKVQGHVDGKGHNLFLCLCLVTTSIEYLLCTIVWIVKGLIGCDMTARKYQEEKGRLLSVLKN